MVTNAVALAAAGALYPVAFAAIVAMLGGPQPLERSLVFLAGAALVSLAGFAVVIVVVDATEFTPRHHPVLAAWIKVGLGAILLLLAARTVLRRRRAVAVGTTYEAPPEPAPSDTEAPRLRRAFISGVLIYLPGVFLIASAKAIADAGASLLVTVAEVVVCVVVLLLIVEIPIAAYAIAPTRVQPPLERTTLWARAHAGQLVFLLELVGGAYLLISGVRST